MIGNDKIGRIEKKIEIQMFQAPRDPRELKWHKDLCPFLNIIQSNVSF